MRFTISNGEPITPRGNFMLPTWRVPYINPGLKITPEKGKKKKFMYSECHIVKRAMLYLSVTIPQVVISTTPNFCFCQRLEPKEKLHRTTVRPSKLDVFIGQQRKIFDESIMKKCMMLKWISCSTSENSKKMHAFARR